MNTEEMSREEKALVISLESNIRDAVWISTAKKGDFEVGKWAKPKLRIPTRVNAIGKPREMTLKTEDSTEDLLESYCALGWFHIHTVSAVYQILRELKKRGLLNVQGFGCLEARPRSKRKD